MQKMAWGHCSPQLITDLVKRYCSVKGKKPLKSCQDITLLPPEAIQPIKWFEIHDLFEPKQQENDLQFQQVIELRQYAK